MGMGALKLLSLPAICLFGISATTPTVDAIRHWHVREVRVEEIARRISTSNIRSCPEKSIDYGFTAMSPNATAPAEVRAAWKTALQVGDGSTIVSVFPNSPAQVADLHVGDTVIAANGVRWAESPAEKAAFSVALTKGALEPKLHLTIRHEGREMAMDLTGQDACNASVTLIADRHINASSSGNIIFVNSGLEELLPNDDELAFIIAHETAHIILGHSKLGRDALKVHDKRMAMEEAADALGLRLMLRAGYAPESAAAANAKIAHAARGPISKLLNLHGPYMAPEERSTFLAQQALQARSENTPQ